MEGLLWFLLVTVTIVNLILCVCWRQNCGFMAHKSFTCAVPCPCLEPKCGCGDDDRPENCPECIDKHTGCLDMCASPSPLNFICHLSQPPHFWAHFGAFWGWLRNNLMG